MVDLFAHPPQNPFPPDFLWGVAQPDLRLENLDDLRRLGARACSLAFSWARILPEGRWKPDEQALGEYNRLIEKLLDHGIAPFVILSHGELPDIFARRGGWLYRDTAFYFHDYAGLCADYFRGRVNRWITINDPGGYAEAALPHLLLAHNQGVPVIHDAGGETALAGMAVNLKPTSSDGLPDPLNDVLQGLAGPQDFLGVNGHTNGLAKTLLQLHDACQPKQIIITEIDSAIHEQPEEASLWVDVDRQLLMKLPVMALSEAIKGKVPVTGCFAKPPAG